MSAYSAAVLADSPYVYYRLNETSGTALTDSSGNARGATLTSSLPPGSTASLLAADADPCITFDYNAVLGPLRADGAAGSGYTTAPLTCEFWIKPVDLTTSGGVCMPVSCNVGGTNGWVTYYAPSTGVWHWLIQNINDYAFTAAAVAGVTQHMVFVASTVPDVSLYVNGAFSQTIATGNIVSGGDIIIGNQNSLGHPIKAAVDEVALYSTALSPTRIAAHYAAATALPSQAGINFLRQGDRRA